MIYVFGGLLIASFVKQKEVLFGKKRNIFMFVFLSTIGLALGVVHMIRPYIPSIAYTLQQYLK